MKLKTSLLVLMVFAILVSGVSGVEAKHNHGKKHSDYDAITILARGVSKETLNSLFALGNGCISTGKGGNLFYIWIPGHWLYQIPPQIKELPGYQDSGGLERRPFDHIGNFIMSTPAAVVFALGNDCTGTGKSGELYGIPPNSGHEWTILGIPPNSGHDWTVYALGNDINMAG